MRYHIVGIAGAGMSAIAHMLLDQGHIVSGSDRQDNRLTEALRGRGAQIHLGHDAQYVAGAEVVIATSAVQQDHPELVAARTHGVDVLKRADVWRQWSAQRSIIAVAGTHGKTTTTAMISFMLLQAGIEAGFLIGAEFAQLGVNARWGDSSAPLVIEADEYDYTFLGLSPDIAVITNIEWDHPDIYPTAADYTAAFAQFAAQTRRALVVSEQVDTSEISRQIFACGSSPTQPHQPAEEHGLLPHIEGLSAHPHREERPAADEGEVPDTARERPFTSLAPGSSVGYFHQSAATKRATVVRYGFAPDNTYRVLPQSDEPSRSGKRSVSPGWTIAYGSATEEVQVVLHLAVPGKHNVANALAAVCVADVLGIDTGAAARSLGSFQGVARRFEHKGEVDGITVIDDYAHHPTEVRATLAAARLRYGRRRLVAYVQPHTFSRTQALLEQWSDALQEADIVFIGAIYASREAGQEMLTQPTNLAADEALAKVLIEKIAGTCHHVLYAGRVEDAPLLIQKHVQPGDVVLTMGAGDGFLVGERLLELLRHQQGDS
jgi:UDP-N-acetylmuramate--alanine ligase